MELTPASLQARRRLSVLLLSLALVAAVTGVVLLLEPYVPHLLGVPALYLLTVLAVAARCGAGFALVVAVTSVAVFAVVFVPGNVILADDPRYLMVLGVFLGTATTAAAVTVWLRRQVWVAIRRTAEPAALCRVSTSVAGGTAPEDLVGGIADEIEQVVGVGPVLLLRLEADGAVTVVGQVGNHPDDVAVGSRLQLDPRGAMVEVLRTGRLARRDAWVAVPIVVGGHTWGHWGSARIATVSLTAPSGGWRASPIWSRSPSGPGRPRTSSPPPGHVSSLPPTRCVGASRMNFTVGPSSGWPRWRCNFA
jgi:Domain of unknown function (DUF4118)